MKTALESEKSLFALLLKIFMVFSNWKMTIVVWKGQFLPKLAENVENKPNSEQIWYLFVILERFVISFQ